MRPYKEKIVVKEINEFLFARWNRRQILVISAINTRNEQC